MNDFKLANLSQNRLKEIKQLESKLGVTIVAYEEEKIQTIAESKKQND